MIHNFSISRTCVIWSFHFSPVRKNDRKSNSSQNALHSFVHSQKRAVCVCVCTGKRVRALRSSSILFSNENRHTSIFYLRSQSRIILKLYYSNFCCNSLRCFVCFVCRRYYFFLFFAIIVLIESDLISLIFASKWWSKLQLAGFHFFIIFDRIELCSFLLTTSK